MWATGCAIAGCEMWVTTSPRMVWALEKMGAGYDGCDRRRQSDDCSQQPSFLA
jgi:hypothetical protein